MNLKLDLTTSTGLSAAIDRLIAGELDQSDRQTVLQELELIPNGWRQCALGFLEDQAWRTALSRPSNPIFRTTPPKSALRSGRRNTPAYAAMAVLAASLVVALCSLLLQPGRESSSQLSGAPLRTQTDPSQVVNQHSSQPQPELSVAGKPTQAAEVEPGQPLGYLSVSNPEDGELPPQEVAILEATAANEQWLQEQPSSIPEYVKALWRRRGFEVEENRRLVGLDLEDGRRVALPIDELSIDYVGRQPL